MKTSFKGEKVFDFFNGFILIFLALTCLLPFVHVLAVSLSDSPSASAGRVGLWPINFNLEAYMFAFQKKRFIGSMLTSVNRLWLGVLVNTVLTILTAYPLSKSGRELKGRTVFAWFFVITMLIGGGLIPTYMVVMGTGLRNTIWALIIPGAVPVFNVVILLNFFRQLPKELEESAFLDGAGQWRILLQIFIPLSVPALATLVIFQAVGHWNEWFSGIIYMENIEKYPLASYMQNILVRPNFDDMSADEIRDVLKISDRSFSAAQIMISTLPIILVYPFLQRYFVKGMVLGSLKG
jgi:putative aldouronate transport system permease protein